MRGRQGQRSRAAPTAVHHLRQYSDNFLDTSSNGRWLQSAGLQNLHNNSSSIPPLQDYNFYGGGGGGEGAGLSMNWSGQRSFDGGNEFYLEPTSPHVASRLSSHRKAGDELPSQFSPALLDLHSFDTELLPELPVCGMYDSSSLFHPVRGRSFDDSEPYNSSKQQTGRELGIQDNNLLKSFGTDKDQISSVAKIKVVVRKRPMNKKELAKNEEDIIATHSNSLTIHETKLKACSQQYLLQLCCGCGP